MTRPDFVYTTYIKSTPQKVWDAITNPEFTRQYWTNENISDWKKGSEWKHVNKEGNQTWIVGKILESNPPRRLVLTWAEPSDLKDDSQVTFEIEPNQDMVRLIVTHGGFKADSKLPNRISMGWPLVLSNLKSFLETGKVMDIWSWKGQCSTSSEAAA